MKTRIVAGVIIMFFPLSFIVAGERCKDCRDKIQEIYDEWRESIELLDKAIYEAEQEIEETYPELRQQTIPMLQEQRAATLNLFRDGDGTFPGYEQRIREINCTHGSPDYELEIQITNN